MTSTPVLIAILFWLAIAVPMSIAVGRYLRHLDEDTDDIRVSSGHDAR
jgi:hypothetical protein